MLRIMKRRCLIASPGAALVLPVAAAAEQRAMPLIGCLSGTSADRYAPFVAASGKASAQAGFAEGQGARKQSTKIDPLHNRKTAAALDRACRPA
jgi:hypothetical protein